MKSMQVLQYSSEEGKLLLRARDFRPMWMTAVKAMDDDTYIGESCNGRVEAAAWSESLLLGTSTWRRGNLDHRGILKQATLCGTASVSLETECISFWSSGVISTPLCEGGENSCNIFVVHKGDDAAPDEERTRLEVGVVYVAATFLGVQAAAGIQPCLDPQASGHVFPVLLLITSLLPFFFTCHAQVIGQYHVGEFINRFQKGSLVMKLPDSGVQTLQYHLIEGVRTARVTVQSLPVFRRNMSQAQGNLLDPPFSISVSPLPSTELSQAPLMLFGTINGVIGLIASLSQDQFQFLERLEVRWHCEVDKVFLQWCWGPGYPGCSLRHQPTNARMQAAMLKVVKGVGGLDHGAWRSFVNTHTQPTPACGFVDGDLVEQFLDLR